MKNEGGAVGCRSHLARTWFATALVCATGSAAGAGFSLTEYSIRGMGSSYAGSTADAAEAATIYWNPAGLTRLPGIQAQAGAVLVDLQARFEDQGSTQTLLTSPGPPATFVTLPSRGRDDDGGGYSVTPSLYLSSALSERLSIGLGVQVPFGLQTEYDDGWVGRYHALKSSITSIDINPSMAYRIDDHWSVGFGVSAQYVDATLSRALFTGAADGKVEVDGDDWSLGYNVGLLYELSDATRFGLSFRSGIDHDLKGHRDISGVAPGVNGRVNATTPLSLPPNVAFGFHHRLMPRLTLMGDLTWTGWSSFDEVRISFDDGSPDDVTVSNWNNNWRASLGAAFELTPQWTLRSGLMFDQTPIPGAQERTPRIPGADRYWISAGATWRINDSLRMDIAYSHLFFADADIDNSIDLAPTVAPGAFQDTLLGRFDTAVDAVALELRYAF